MTSWFSFTWSDLFAKKSQNNQRESATLSKKAMGQQLQTPQEKSYKIDILLTEKKDFLVTKMMKEDTTDDISNEKLRCSGSVDDDNNTHILTRCGSRSTTCSTVLIHDEECVLCLGEFDQHNPQIFTLCSCGENRTKFHYPCLLLWMEKKPVCPTCDSALFYQEGVYKISLE